MKLLRRLLILFIAAALGTIVFNRYHAAKNVMPNASSPPATSRMQDPIGEVGGIGQVKNPYPAKPSRNLRRKQQ